MTGLVVFSKINFVRRDCIVTDRKMKAIFVKNCPQLDMGNVYVFDMLVTYKYDNLGYVEISKWTSGLLFYETATFINLRNSVKLYMYIPWTNTHHYGDVIMGTIASPITSLTIVYSTVYSDADQRKHQSTASLAFVWGIHRGPVNSPHKWPVTRKMFPFDDVIMTKTYMMWEFTQTRHKIYQICLWKKNGTSNS